MIKKIWCFFIRVYTQPEKLTLFFQKLKEILEKLPKKVFPEKLSGLRVALRNCCQMFNKVIFKNVFIKFV